MKGVLVSWSGGKDSCLALQEIQRAPNMRVEALLTTVTRDFDRISMHGVRRVLLERQAASLGLPLHQILISKGATNEEYESKMGEAFSVYRNQGSILLRLAISSLRRSEPIVNGFSPSTIWAASIRYGGGTQLN